MPNVTRIIHMGAHYTPKKDDFPEEVMITSFAAMLEKGAHAQMGKHILIG